MKENPLQHHFIKFKKNIKSINSGYSRNYVISEALLQLCSSLNKSGLFHQQRTADNAYFFSLYEDFDNASSKSPHIVIPFRRRLPAEMIELHLSMWILLVCI